MPFPLRRLTPIAAVVALLAGVLSAGLGTPPPASATASAPSVAGAFVPVTPTRVLDSRAGNGVPRGRIAAGGTATVRIAGRAGLPSSGVGAVTLTLTATNVTSGGYVTAFPAGGSRPVVSDLNVVAGRTLANLVTVPLGATGAVSLYVGTSKPLDLVADVSGYYLAGAATAAGTFTAVAPARVLDTRSGLGAPRRQVVGGGTVALAVAGRGGVPAGTGARSVVLNVTVVGPRAGGYLTAFAGGAARPTASNLNYAAGQTVAVQVTVPVGADGTVALYLGGGPADVLADVQGFTRSGAVFAAGGFRAVPPERRMDTRIQSTDLGYTAVPAGGQITVQLYPGVPLPEDALTAALVAVTAVAPTGSGYLTVFPAGGTRPLASTLNFPAGATVANAAAVPLGPDQSISLYNGSNGTVEVLVDLAGFWLDGTRTGAVSGRVTAADGTPLAGVTIGLGDDITSNTTATDAVTDRDGRYLLDGLAVWSDNSLCWTTTRATPVATPNGLASVCSGPGVATRAGRVTTLDRVLTQPGAVVHGRVLDAVGAPLAGVGVHMGGNTYSGFRSDTVTTGPDGGYRIPGLPDNYLNELCLDTVPGSGAHPTGYVTQCDSPNSSGDGADITFDLRPRAAVLLSGRVTDTKGRPLSHVGVQARAGYDPTGRGIQAWTGADGRWRAPVDPDDGGDVFVCFQGRHDYSIDIHPLGGTSTTGYVERCWKDLPVQYGTSGADYTPIPAEAGDVVAGVDGALPAAAAISGQARRPGGAPMAGVIVAVRGETGDARFTYEEAQTGADGRYRVAGLLTGTYTVCFLPTRYNPIPPPTGLITQCHGETDPYTGAPIALVNGTEATGIDADLNGGGTLTGHVTDVAGGPVSGVHVTAGYRSATTDADGAYRIEWADPVPTPICLSAGGAAGPSPTGYLDTCWGGEQDPLHRTPFVVVAGATTVADFALAPAPGVRVTVTDSAGNGLAGVQVSANPTDGGFGAAATSDVNGVAVIGPLEPGRYTVCADEAGDATGGVSPGGYGRRCFGWTPRRWSSPVQVPSSGIAAVSIALPSYAGVSGTLTDSSGRPVRGAYVDFETFDPDNGSTQDYTQTAADGSFDKTGLLPGTYRICFRGGVVDGVPGLVRSSCWQNLPNDDGSGWSYTPIDLPAGRLTGGVDQVVPGR